MGAAALSVSPSDKGLAEVINEGMILTGDVPLHPITDHPAFP
jgi:hypothetical protein